MNIYIPLFAEVALQHVSMVLRSEKQWDVVEALPDMGNYPVNFYLLVSSADNLCKQFGPRSGPTKCRACSGTKLFGTLMVFLKDIFLKVDFEKISI